jgi:hypothetical protein
VSLLSRIASVFSSPDERLHQHVLDIERSPIAAARDGALVRVVGRVVAAEEGPLTSPLTGYPVVCFRVRYEVLHRNDDTNDVVAAFGVLSRDHKPAEWVTEVADGHACSFYVDDDSGMLAKIDGSMARFAIREHHVTDTRFLDAEPEPFKTFMREHGVPTTLYMGSDLEKRFYESRIAVGEVVTVAGTARRVAGLPRNDGYRSGSTEHVALGDPVVTQINRPDGD